MRAATDPPAKRLTQDAAGAPNFVSLLSAEVSPAAQEKADRLSTRLGASL